MNEDERRELAERRNRAELERLRREQAIADFNAVIRKHVRGAREERQRTGKYTPDDILRAVEADIAAGQRFETREQPGSLTSVAKRLGIARRTLFKLHRDWWGKQAKWPPDSLPQPSVND